MSTLLGPDTLERRTLKQVWGIVTTPTSQSRSERAKEVLLDSMQRLFRTPLLSAVTLLSLVILSSFLLSGGSLISGIADSARTLPQNVRFVVAVSGANEGGTLKSFLAKRPEILQFEEVSPDVGLQRMKEALSLPGELFQALQNDNPLPLSFLVTLRDNLPIASQQEFLSEIRSRPEVTEVSFDQSVFEAASQIAAAIQSLGWIALIGIGFMGASSVGFLILLNLYAHRRELEVMKLCGASDMETLVPAVIDGVMVTFVGLVVGSVISVTLLSTFASSLSGVLLSPPALSFGLVTVVGSIVLLLSAGVSAGCAIVFLSSHRGGKGVV